jgi:hypothetical protein
MESMKAAKAPASRTGNGFRQPVDFLKHATPDRNQAEVERPRWV